MLKFKVIEELKPNTEILELLENYTYTIKKGQINSKDLIKLEKVYRQKESILYKVLDYLRVKPLYKFKSVESISNILTSNSTLLGIWVVAFTVVPLLRSSTKISITSPSFGR